MTIKNFLSKNKPLIITVGFACLSLVLWIVTAAEVRVADFFLNLFACFTASAITVGIVDRISRKREEERLIPIRQAIYRDVQLFVSRITYLWKEMYVQSQPDRSEIPIEQLFTSKTIDDITSSLDLEKEPNIIPKRTWFTYIGECSSEMTKMAENILERYSFFLSPELIQAIHYSLTDCTFSCGRLDMVTRIYTMDKRNSIPRPPLLKYYLVAPQEQDFEQVRHLISWCKQEYAYLNDKKAFAYPLSENVIIMNPHIPPSSRINEEKMAQKMRDFEKWTKSNPTIQ